jgi:hypothetical protein
MKLFDRDMKIRLVYGAGLAIIWFGLGRDAFAGAGALILTAVAARMIPPDDY